jgi:hypothetical protein
MKINRQERPVVMKEACGTIPAGTVLFPEDGFYSYTHVDESEGQINTTKIEYSIKYVENEIADKTGLFEYWEPKDKLPKDVDNCINELYNSICSSKTEDKVNWRVAGVRTLEEIQEKLDEYKMVFKLLDNFEHNRRSYPFSFNNPREAKVVYKNMIDLLNWVLCK